MLELDPGVLLDEVLARLDDRRRVVVLLVVRHGDPLVLLLGDGVGDLDREVAERRRRLGLVAEEMIGMERRRRILAVLAGWGAEPEG